MAIIIQNIDPDPQPEGVQRYQLRINRKVICEFTHRREEPLHACLRRAAEAAERQLEQTLREFLLGTFGEK